MSHHHEEHSHNPAENKFFKNCYEDDGAGLFAFIWTLIIFICISAILIFG